MILSRMSENFFSAARAITAFLLLAGVFFTLGVAPPMAGPDGVYLGEAFRIFYFHVPAAWCSFLSLFVSFVASIGYLWKRTPGWDAVAVAGAEVGWVLAGIVITTGPIWGKAAWGAWWIWEPRLTSFLVLWLLYLGYLVLRKAIEEPDRRARYAAILSIIAFLDVPIIYFSIRLWGSIGHPAPGGGFLQDPVIRTVLLANVAAFMTATGYFIARRAALELHRED
jgi:heme exporter protein C